MASEVDAYVAALDPKRAERVGAVVAAVRRVAPDAAESIEYKMPMFRKGDRHFGVADRANYISLYIGAELAMELIASDPKLKGGKGCVNVTDSRPMPIAALEAALIRRFAG